MYADLSIFIANNTSSA